MAPALELVTHTGPFGKRKLGGTDMEDIKSFSRLPFDKERFLKNLRYILGKLETMDDGEIAELEQRKETGALDEVSDWLIEKEDTPVEEGDPSVNDMDLV